VADGWIGVDLDGTLARYDGWKGEDHIGEPIPAMVERVKRFLAEGREVRIFTARASFTGRTQERLARNVRLIEDWCIAHLGAKLRVTSDKDYGMIALYDDRAVQVEFNSGRLIGEL
jgi:hypothetical protein